MNLPDDQAAVPARDTLQHRFFRGVMWLGAGKVISEGLGVISWVLVARILGAEVFGELSMVRQTVGWFGVFAGFGLALTGTKHVAELRRSDPDRTGRIIGLARMMALGCGALMAVLVFAAAPLLAAGAINRPDLQPELRIACWLLLLNAMTGSQSGVLAGFEAFRAMTFISVIRGLIAFPLLLAGTHWFGLRGAVWALVIVAAVAWLLNHLAVRAQSREHGVRISYAGALLEGRVLVEFSLPAFVSRGVVAPAAWVARAMVAHRPGGYVELGLFGAAILFGSRLRRLSEPVGRVLLPLLASEEGALSGKLQRANVLLSWAMGVFPALVIIAFPQLIGRLFGAQYAGPEFDRVVIVVTCFSCIAMYKQGLSRALAARSLMWWAALNNATWAVATVALTRVLADWGALGLATAFLGAYILTTVVFVPLYVYRGFVPRNTVISPQAAFVWLAIVGTAAVSLLGWGPFARGAVCAGALLVSALAFASLARGPADDSTPGVAAEDTPGPAAANTPGVAE